MTVTVSGAYNSHDLYQIREAARKKKSSSDVAAQSLWRKCAKTHIYTQLSPYTSYNNTRHTKDTTHRGVRKKNDVKCHWVVGNYMLCTFTHLLLSYSPNMFDLAWVSIKYACMQVCLSGWAFDYPSDHWRPGRRRRTCGT